LPARANNHLIASVRLINEAYGFDTTYTMHIVALHDECHYTLPGSHKHLI
jgi:hypothetical protein